MYCSRNGYHVAFGGRGWPECQMDLTRVNPCVKVRFVVVYYRMRKKEKK